jgi:hypothetical protein
MTSQQDILDAQATLLQAQHMYNDIYKSISNSADSIQTSNLAMKVASMNSKLVEMKNETRTYDTQYKDFANSGEKPSIWQRYGLVTVQDWVLFFFFTVYSLFVLGLIITASMSGTNILVAIFTILIVAFIVAVLIATILMRYG